AKGRALTRVATPEDEERLLGVGRGGTAAQVERIVRGWRRVDRQAEAKESARQHATRALHVYDDEDGTVVVRGRLAPEVGALLRRALAAARETLYQQRRHEATATSPTDASADTPSKGSAAGGRAGAARGDGLAPGPRSRRAGRALPGGGARRRACAGRPRSARAVRPGGRDARLRGDVAAAGVRREPGGDAPGRRRAHRRDRRPEAHDPPGVAAGAAAPGPGLPLPGLRAPDGRGASHPTLGARRPDHALQPRAPLSLAPP